MLGNTTAFVAKCSFLKMPQIRTLYSKYWCFTINHPSNADDIQLDFKQWPLTPTFAVYNLEFGEIDQTPHYQGYLELPTHKALQWMKARLPRAHLEKRKGSRWQAILYCLKDCAPSSPERIQLSTTSSNTSDSPMTVNLDGIWSQLWPIVYGFSGEWTSLKADCEENLTMNMPRKKALMIMKKMIQEGCTDEQLADFHFPTYLQSSRQLTSYRMLICKPRDFKPKVIVCQGPTGTGKSKWIAETFPSAYWKQRSNWWDGYMAHEVVCIDEFYGWLPFDLCLRLCDRYPLNVETKGGNVNFVAKTIVFTSNNMPSSWWKHCYFPSFVRRVDEWHTFPTWGQHEVNIDYVESRFFNNLN